MPDNASPKAKSFFVFEPFFLWFVNYHRGHKLDHLALNSTTAVAVEARVTPALPATVVVEFMANWLNLYPRTVCQRACI